MQPGTQARFVPVISSMVPAPMLVYTTGSGVHGFTLDPSYGEFVLSHEDMKIPGKGKNIQHQ